MGATRMGAPVGSTSATATSNPAPAAYPWTAAAMASASAEDTGVMAGLCAPKNSALISAKCCRCGGRFSSRKMASTGHTKKHCSQAMHTSGSM
jgi:hypothetical protein